MGSIPLVESFYDVRNGASVVFYACLAAILGRVLLAVDSVNHQTSGIIANTRSTPSSSPTSGRRPKLTSYRAATVMNGNGVSHTASNGSMTSSIVTNANSSSSSCHALTSNGCSSNGFPLDHSYSLPRTNGVCRGRSSSHSRRPGVSPVDDVIVSDCSDSDVTSSSSAHVALVSLALIVIPFIPATNLFFYVGFVVAERVLYIPSLGLCLLVADGLTRLVASTPSKSYRWWRHRAVVYGALVGLLATWSVKTIVRNVDWWTEESLYRSGINVNPAKGLFSLDLHSSIIHHCTTSVSFRLMSSALFSNFLMKRVLASFRSPIMQRGLFNVTVARRVACHQDTRQRTQ